MTDSAEKCSSNKKSRRKHPDDLTVCIVLQYAKSLRVNKRLPYLLNSFIVN